MNEETNESSLYETLKGYYEELEVKRAQIGVADIKPIGQEFRGFMSKYLLSDLCLDFVRLFLITRDEEEWFSCLQQKCRNTDKEKVRQAIKWLQRPEQEPYCVFLMLALQGRVDKEIVVLGLAQLNA